MAQGLDDLESPQRPLLCVPGLGQGLVFFVFFEKGFLIERRSEENFLGLIICLKIRSLFFLGDFVLFVEVDFVLLVQAVLHRVVPERVFLRRGRFRVVFFQIEDSFGAIEQRIYHY